VDIVAWSVMTKVFTRMLVPLRKHRRAVARRSDAGPCDVTMTILLADLAPSGQGKSSVIILAVNPGFRPVLVGLSVSRQRGPAWPGMRLRTRIARRTDRRRYRAGRQAAIGIVPAEGDSALPVRFDAIPGRYRVVAVIGQSDHRLRVISMPFVIQPEGDTPLNCAALTDPFPWLIFPWPI
jgi:hypothetical protein